MKSSLKRKEPQGADSLAGRILEYLGISRACVRSIDPQEEDMVHVNLPLEYTDWKPVETALLEAEHQKGGAITQIRRQKIL